MSLKLSTGDIPEVIKYKTKSNNLIPFPYSETSRIEEGITYTVNEEDGTILMNGTATLASNFYLTKSLTLEKGKTYTINSNSSIPLTIEDTTYKQIVTSITIPQTFTAEYDNYYIFTTVGKGNVLDNVVVKPQLEEGSTATEYSRNGHTYDVEKVVYKDVNNNVEEIVWIKPVNLIEFEDKSQTITGVTWTEDATNKTIVANGTATAASTFNLYTMNAGGKQLKLSGCPAGSSATSYYLYVYDEAKNTSFKVIDSTVFTATGNITVYVKVEAGIAVTGIIFTPVLSETI